MEIDDYKPLTDLELPHTCPGWHGLLLGCHRELIEIDPGYRVLVTEKFGMLRIYIAPDEALGGHEAWNDSMWDVLRGVCEKYEHYATTTCQYCGALGEHRSWDGWYAVQCADCARKSPTEKMPL